MKFSCSILAVLAAFTSAACATGNVRMLTWVVKPDSAPNDGISVNETISSLNSTVPNDSEMNYYANYTQLAWSTRRIAVANEVLFNKVQVFAIQGVYTRQMTDLIELLGSNWVYEGVGRDDGVESGEYVAVFYDTDYIKSLSYDVFWLSNTPATVSKYSGAGSYRIATVVKLSLISTGDDFTVISTHLDDASNDARKVGASLIRYRAAYEASLKGEPVFLLGCLNSSPGDSSADAYEISTGTEDMVSINSDFSANYTSAISNSFYFIDVLDATKPERRSGHFSTVSGWNKIGDTSSFERSSFGFGSSTGGWLAQRYRVGENFFDDEYHQSLHRPLYFDVSVGVPAM
ncbi:uncharacterized protein V1516DRAFT_629267 [Lipomyces oligophaga]|uniref:uncharacterized protein n=1 Tax=Lipomyces oligophaga TaxID=45792 RepID=UPI0034CE0141